MLSSQGSKEAHYLARACTLTILGRTDGARKKSVVQSLHESQLTEKEQPIVTLGEADLSDAHLSDHHLIGAYLAWPT